MLALARAFLVALCCYAVLSQDARANEVLVVSRARILSETNAAIALRDAERMLRSELRDWLADRKAQLDSNERILTNLRQTLPKEEFDQRTEAFDRQVRSVRRSSQRSEAALQRAFRDARKELLTSLYPILIEILKSRNAKTILDADQILIASPDVDVTDEVIALFNERVAAPTLPPFDDLIAETAAERAADAENRQP